MGLKDYIITYDLSTKVDEIHAITESKHQQFKEKLYNIFTPQVGEINIEFLPNTTVLISSPYTTKEIYERINSELGEYKIKSLLVIEHTGFDPII